MTYKYKAKTLNEIAHKLAEFRGHFVGEHGLPDTCGGIRDMNNLMLELYQQSEKGDDAKAGENQI